MQVVGERVLLRHVLLPAMTKGGIFRPETSRGNSHECIVLGVGTRVKHPDIKEGDRVIIQKRQGQVVNVGDQVLRMVHYDDVVAKVKVGKVELCPACGGQGTVVKQIVSLFPDEECD